MNIGIIVLTRNRLKEMAQVLDAIEKHTTVPFRMAVSMDRCVPEIREYLEKRYPNNECDFLETPGEGGIASNRNISFHHFRNKDIVFMFEDDFMPAQDGWQSRYVEVLSRGTHPCLFALNKGLHGEVVDQSNQSLTDALFNYIPVLYRPMLTTQLTAINTSLLKTLGYFSLAYGTRYGFEDSEWGSRGRDGGLFGSKLGFPCLEQKGVFEDILEPTSSDGKTLEQREADKVVNWETFKETAQRPMFLEYPYEENA